MRIKSVWAKSRYGVRGRRGDDSDRSALHHIVRSASSRLPPVLATIRLVFARASYANSPQRLRRLQSFEQHPMLSSTTGHKQARLTAEIPVELPHVHALANPEIMLGIMHMPHVQRCVHRA